MSYGNLMALKFNMREDGGSRRFTDAELTALLLKNNQDVSAASYEGLIRKAEMDAINLPDVSMESTRAYWLSLAEMYRPNTGGTLRRADEVNRGEE